MILVDEFDPSHPEHVAWLKRMIEIANDLGSVNLLDEIQKNPMNVPFPSDKLLNWPMIHFGLAMKFTKFTLSRAN